MCNLYKRHTRGDDGIVITTGHRSRFARECRCVLCATCFVRGGRGKGRKKKHKKKRITNNTDDKTKNNTANKDDADMATTTTNSTTTTSAS